MRKMSDSHKEGKYDKFYELARSGSPDAWLSCFC